MQQFDHLTPAQMAQHVEQLARQKQYKPNAQLWLQSIMAGLFIGLGFAFYITVTTQAQSDWGLVRLIGGLCFSMGLMLVVICGSELFTSTLLTLLPFANGSLSRNAMLRCWGTVLLGNAVGALLICSIFLIAEQHQLAQGGWGLSVLKLAQHKLHHSFSSAVALGLLCNLMVCLAVWMAYAGKTLLEKTLLLMLPVAMFVACGFEHSIANLFLVPLAIGIHSVADNTFWQQIGLSSSQFADLTWWHFIIHNLIPVLIGNILGAAMVAYSQWYLHFRSATQHATSQPASVNNISYIDSKNQFNQA